MIQSKMTKVYPDRQINNIYFDDLYYTALRDNIVGLSKREKYRIRWHGETFSEIDEPVLEIKRKNGLMGTKDNYKINPITVEKNHFSPRRILDSVLHSEVPEIIKCQTTQQRATLLNSYNREYFALPDHSVRITFDRGLSFYPITSEYGQILNCYVQRDCIMEVKYSEHFRIEAESFMNSLPFRMTRNSKYVQGLAYSLAVDY